MHLPYIHKMLQRAHPGKTSAEYPPLVPIMVGSTSDSTELAFGELLAPYVADECNAFVISSDFCHWGARFGYTYYCPTIPKSMPDPESPTPILPSSGLDAETVESILAAHALSTRDKSPRDPTIHESIAAVDLACMTAVHEGNHDGFADLIRKTGNTVCGRHPIGVMMAAVESLNQKSGEDGEGRKGVFRFVRYERSSDVVSVRDSSVSYVSAFAVL
jgi:AmmeMemoRadiSam system protein B